MGARMQVVDAAFLQSGAADPRGWPADGAPELAFAGRSNVGKSTLLAALLGRRGLVRTSNTPGRTRLINWFTVRLAGDREVRFVDLPGYGYAKVSKSERADWLRTMEAYLGGRASLRACVLLVDGRRVPPGIEAGDLLDETEIAGWLRGRGVAVIPVLTKADQLSKHERRPAADRLRRIMQLGGTAPVVVSATDGDGLDDLRARLAVALGPASD